MSMLLRWKNNTPGNFITEIYRSATTFTSANKPTTPIVTLENGEEEYYDADAAQGAQYYYMWATYDVARTRVAYSAVMRLLTAEYTGPGSRSLSYGNEKYGYYGMVQYSELPYLEMLLDNMGQSSIRTAVGASFAHHWQKWAYKGKILFVSSGQAVKTSWKTLYENGMVYGDIDQDTVPGAPTGPNRIEKVLRVVNGADEYIVRLLRGYSYDLSEQPNFDSVPNGIANGTAPAGLRDNEYDMLLLGEGTIVPDISPSFVATSAPSIATLCAESDAATSRCYVRGAESVLGGTERARLAESYISTTDANSQLNTYIVLELVRK